MFDRVLLFVSQSVHNCFIFCLEQENYILIFHKLSVIFCGIIFFCVKKKLLPSKMKNPLTKKIIYFY